MIKWDKSASSSQLIFIRLEENQEVDFSEMLLPFSTAIPQVRVTHLGEKISANGLGERKK